MFAYRHAFHAGNHADVLKHLALALVLRHMAAKDKPYTLVDTHAGAGGYSLEGRFAQKRSEFTEGVGRLWSRKDLPPAAADYVALVRRFNPDGVLRQYPGSPAIAQMLRRPGDRLRLYEMHPTDQRILAAYLGKEPGVQVAHSDGFAALKAEMPPPSRRGVVLIDPSYELKADYPRVIAAVREALTRFADALIVVWYPQLQSLESTQLPNRLQAAAGAAPRGWLHVRLTAAQSDTRGFGLIGSGLVVINPPHTLHDALKAELPWLVDTLGQFDGANYLLEQQAA